MSFRGKLSVLVVSAASPLYAVIGGMSQSRGHVAQQPINDAGAQIRIFESVFSIFRTITLTSRIWKKSVSVPSAGWPAGSIRIRLI